MISAGAVLLAALGYLATLFLLAWLAERGTLPLALARHPLTYTLSLGVYATSWTFYGSVGLAQSSGLLFLSIYIGLTVAMAMGPVLLQPLLRLVRAYQLSSLADLLAFRFRRKDTGAWVTAAMLIGSIPYLSLQIRAVTEAVQTLTGSISADTLALGFCALLAVFAVLFGARHLTPREQHEGLVVAIAFESAVKLGALLAVGGFALYGVFGGLDGISRHLAARPEALEALYRPLEDGPWLSLCALSFCAAFMLPRQFHMLFTENHSPDALRVAYWAFPLYLLLLNLPILPILWAGQLLAPGTNADLYVMVVSIAAQSPTLALLALIGGLSAASAMVIVATLSLSSMVINHWIAPAGMVAPMGQFNLYRELLWGKRIAIAAIIAAAFGFYQVIEDNSGLAQMGLISFVAIAQFLPGVLALLFWQRATSEGFMLGLGGGFAVWFGTLIVPLLVNADILDQQVDLSAVFGGDGANIWSVATFWSLAINTALLVLGSLITLPDAEETEAAEQCASRGDSRLSGTVQALSPAQFASQLEQIMGPPAADQEVRQALRELDLGWEEHRPAALRRLRERIERNLSGLLGPTLARLIVDDQLRLDPQSNAALADSFRLLEARLEHSRSRLRGAERELDEMRRYHRDLLQELPIGVCALDTAGTVVIWNSAMQAVAGIGAEQVLGHTLAELPPPWGPTLSDFERGEEANRFKLPLRVDGRRHSYRLHKATVETSASDPAAQRGTVVLVEDRTAIDQLEAELVHTERLASIGRFAAGVAHEIGNPLTGIDSLAQLLAHEEEPAEVARTGAAITEQTRRINRIVKSLLAFARREAAPSLQLERIAAAELLAEAEQLAQLDPAARSIAVHSHSEAGLQLTVDRQQALQMVLNLLANAAAASAPQQGIELSAHREGRQVLIAVRDRGSGIAAAQLETIFEPFYTTKPAGQGTGLGLALVHSIAESHGGRVSVDSAPGHGSTFTVSLPLDGPGETAEHNP